ncbi:hypothetical protein SFR_3966 [Streptomyces sp. FR-008]|nr:hypothetical protein SFR_3966 [Streptomyces sp. FR-008]
MAYAAGSARSCVLPRGVEMVELIPEQLDGSLNGVLGARLGGENDEVLAPGCRAENLTVAVLDVEVDAMAVRLGVPLDLRRRLSLARSQRPHDEAVFALGRRAVLQGLDADGRVGFAVLVRDTESVLGVGTHRHAFEPVAVDLLLQVSAHRLRESAQVLLGRRYELRSADLDVVAVLADVGTQPVVLVHGEEESAQLGVVPPFPRAFRRVFRRFALFSPPLGRDLTVGTRHDRMRPVDSGATEGGRQEQGNACRPPPPQGTHRRSS